MQRTKGASGEREVATLLSTFFDADVRRKLGQARDSGNDIDLEPFVIEVKRYRSLGLAQSALAQAQAAAKGRAGPAVGQWDEAIPLVIARPDEREHMVVLGLTDFLGLVARIPGLAARIRERYPKVVKRQDPETGR